MTGAMFARSTAVAAVLLAITLPVATTAANGKARKPSKAEQAKAPVAAAEAAGQAGDPLADLLAQGKYKEGLEWLRSFGNATPEHERYRGLFHLGLGDADAALRHLVPVYRKSPHDDSLALAVAEASLWKKDYRTGGRAARARGCARGAARARDGLRTGGPLD
jgi:hypothetical protein